MLKKWILSWLIAELKEIIGSELRRIIKEAREKESAAKVPSAVRQATAYSGEVVYPKPPHVDPVIRQRDSHGV